MFLNEIEAETKLNSLLQVKHEEPVVIKSRIDKRASPQMLRIDSKNKDFLENGAIIGTPIISHNSTRNQADFKTAKLPQAALQKANENLLPPLTDNRIA